jgi:acetyl-CoA carboxylase biotin carboxyl carrier protein
MMKDNLFTVAEIKELMAAMSQHEMGKLKIENGEYSILLEGRGQAVLLEAAPLPAAIPAAPKSAGEPAAPALSGNVVTSPIVGTYYESPSPESEAFVKVGSRVKKGDVLFIIESMKLMNEVQSQFDGTVTEILATNAQGVEYGQPVMTINE